MAVTDRLVPITIEVTPVIERIMRPDISHNLSVRSLVSLCAPTKVSELIVREANESHEEVKEVSCEVCVEENNLII